MLPVYRAVQQCLRWPLHIGLVKASSVHTYSNGAICQIDDCGIPVQPTWSVHQLLSSYPKPTLSSETLTRLHKLAALIPSAEGTSGHMKMKEEVEELVRLVEAVKLVNTTEVHPIAHRAKEGVSYGHHQPFLSSGRELLQHASRTSDGFYIVDSEKGRS